MYLQSLLPPPQPLWGWSPAFLDVLTSCDFSGLIGPQSSFGNVDKETFFRLKFPPPQPLRGWTPSFLGVSQSCEFSSLTGPQSSFGNVGRETFFHLKQNIS